MSQNGKLALKWLLRFGSERSPPSAIAIMKLTPPRALMRLKFWVRLVSSGLMWAIVAKHKVKLPAKRPVAKRLINSPAREWFMILRAVNV